MEREKEGGKEVKLIKMAKANFSTLLLVPTMPIEIGVNINQLDIDSDIRVQQETNIQATVAAIVSSLYPPLYSHTQECLL